MLSNLKFRLQNTILMIPKLKFMTWNLFLPSPNVLLLNHWKHYYRWWEYELLYWPLLKDWLWPPSDLFLRCNFLCEKDTYTKLLLELGQCCKRKFILMDDCFSLLKLNLFRHGNKQALPLISWFLLSVNVCCNHIDISTS